jgi:hypothetical protein
MQISAVNDLKPAPHAHAFAKKIASLADDADRAGWREAATSLIELAYAFLDGHAPPTRVGTAVPRLRSL